MTARPYPAGGGNLALAEYWGEECSRMIHSALTPQGKNGQEFALLHAVRCARIAAGHAFKYRPALKPPLPWEQ